MSLIQDGTGGGYAASVSPEHRLSTFSVTETEQVHAIEIGNAYNINTEFISLTGTSASAVLYFKNDEDNPFFVTAIVVGLGSATASDSAQMVVLRNPTAGTIVDNATAAPIKANRNFGSNKALSSTTLVYKGADGNTLTDGDDALFIAVPHATRTFVTVDLELTKGSSLGVTIDPNLSSGSVNCYVALVGFVKDPDV